MDPSNAMSYRPLGRLAELKAHNENSKRFFGRDITNNLEKQRLKKNVSIYEKLPVAKPEARVRSRSLYGSKELTPNNTPNTQSRDAILDYKQDVIDFMAQMQRTEPQDAQKHITEKMRQILIDWMVDVHDSFELKEQTLHLALHYLADYSALHEITKEDYQLAGITCLWIASKYEEIYPPRTRNYIEVTADTYSVKDLKNMEGSIIETLGFDLNRTTALQLLEAMAEHSEATETQKALSLCKYAIETALFEGLAKKHAPLTLVAAAMALSENALKFKWESRLAPSERVGKQELAECMKELCVAMQAGNKFELSALKRKYAKSKHHQVAKMRIGLLD